MCASKALLCTHCVPSPRFYPRALLSPWGAQFGPTAGVNSAILPAPDKWVPDATSRGIYWPTTIMALRICRQRKGVPAPACCTGACSRRHLHNSTKKACAEKLSSSHGCTVAFASTSHHQHNPDDVHDQNHSYHHEHHHHHHHNEGHHGHDHDHYPDNWATRAMRRVGLVRLSSRIEHSGPLAVASILCFLVSLLAALPTVAALVSERVAEVLQAVALCGTYLLSGLPQAVSSVALAAGGHLDTHVLMSLAVAATLYLGMAQEGALLLLLFQVSHFLESKFISRAQGSLERLLAAMPQRATLVAMTQPTSQSAETPGAGARGAAASEEAAAAGGNGKEEAVAAVMANGSGSTPTILGGSDGGGGPDLSSCREVLAESVAVGELVLVRPGEQIPLDGEVVWGTSSVSSAHISGESVPSRMAPGDWVPAGALSTDGALVVRVTAASADSTPARIARMAAEAQASKPQLQRLLDRIGALWSRGVVAATLVAGLVLVAMGVPLLAAPGGALYRALGVLVAGSPCAVVLVPLAYVCAMAAVTRRGVLLKGASALDALAACTTVALDKTGTLTTGELRLTEAALLEHPLSPQRPQMPMARARESPEEGAAATGGGVLAGPQLGDGGGGGRRGVCDLLPLLQRAAATASTATGTAASLSADPDNGGSRLSGGSSNGGGSTGDNGSSGEFEGCELWSKQKQQRGTAAEMETAVAEEEEAWWGEVAVRCAVALSRASTHPVSRAMTQAGPGLERGVSVAGLEQVPGSGVRGVCRLRGRAFQVSFGSLDFAGQALVDALAIRGASATTGGEAAAEAAVQGLRRAALPHGIGGPDGEGAAAVKAISLLVVTPLARTTQHRSVGAAAAVAAESLTTGGEPQVARFCFEDVVRPGVREAVAALRDGSWRRRRRERVGAADAVAGAAAAAAAPSDVGAALRVMMLTGDNPTVAASVAGALSISEYRAAMLPQDKLNFVQEEQQRLKRQQQGRVEAGWSPLTALGGVAKGPRGSSSSSSSNWGAGGSGAVLMMGDGINDAPALAAAHVGVAVASSPRDLVAAASDVIVLNGQGAAALPWMLRLAHRTQSVVRQNLTLAIASMAFATLPTVAGFFPLWLAVLLHEGSTLAVALNSLRLLLSEEAAAGGPGRGDEKFGLRKALGEVWRGLCDLAAPESHGYHHHHHEHEHSHEHGHGHGRDKVLGRRCCGGGHDHNHDHGDDDHHRRHHHYESLTSHHHRNGHHHNHDDDHDHDHAHSGNGHCRTALAGVAAVEASQGQAKPPQFDREVEAGDANVDSGAGGGCGGGGLADPLRVHGPVGRDASAAAVGHHVRGHVPHGGGGGGGGAVIPCCCVRWGSCCSCGGGAAAASAAVSHGYGRLGGMRLGPLLAVAVGDSLGIGCSVFAHPVGPLRRRRRLPGQVGPVVGAGVDAAATISTSAAKIVVAAAATATFVASSGDRVGL